MEKKRFVAVSGTKHYFGDEVFQLDQTVTLIKEPENAHDPEAIRVKLYPIGKVGYVANSVYTVPKGCQSAGRIYDTFDEATEGIVRFVVKGVAVVELIEASKNRSNESKI